jgi:hypothetical protein
MTYVVWNPFDDRDKSLDRLQVIVHVQFSHPLLSMQL